MANKKSIYFDIFARDNSGKTMRGVGKNAELLGDSLRKVGVAAAAGLAVAGAAAVKMGIDSVQAFAAAEEAQNKLNFAYEKFPALTDVSVDAIRRLNSALALKTRFDDDATASAQAVLAQFGLTGQQLMRLTPLLQDYAARTGKDLTGAAEDLGRALLGQGRALKAVGLDLQDAGSLTGNFEQLVAGLSSTVGGFAERDAETAAGKLAILTNRFGEVQEAIGEALMPALDELIKFIENDGLTALEDFAAWFADDGITAIQDFVDTIAQMKEDGSLVPTIVGGLVAITSAQIGLNAAMAANPIGFVILALATLAAQFTYVMANFESFKITAEDTGWGKPLMVMLTGWFGLFAAFAQNWDTIWFNISMNFTLQINGMIAAINFLLAPLQAVLDVINAIAGTRLSVKLDRIDYPRAPGTPTTQRPVNSSQIAGFTLMADGGIIQPTRGGTPAIIGEAGYPEAVIPLTPGALAEYGIGSGETHIHVTLHGVIGSNRSETMKYIVKGIQDAVRLGDIPRGALA